MQTEVSFTRMDQGSYEDYQLLGRNFNPDHAQIANTALSLLKQMAGPTLGYKVDRYVHSLQSATRAHRDGADEEAVVCALLHDIGDVLAPENHSQVAAAMLRPYVNQENYWVVQHHGLFQGYYYYHHIGKDRNGRDQFRDHPHYGACVRFCEDWDQMSFDPDYDTLDLEFFEPMVHRVFARKPRVFD